MEGIRIRRSKRIIKFRKIRSQPLCDEYPSWVPYLSFKDKNCASFLCMILDWMWLQKLYWGRNVCEEKKRT
jgi:hypothetical protein